MGRGLHDGTVVSPPRVRDGRLVEPQPDCVDIQVALQTGQDLRGLHVHRAVAVRRAEAILQYLPGREVVTVALPVHAPEPIVQRLAGVRGRRVRERRMLYGWGRGRRW